MNVIKAIISWFAMVFSGMQGGQGKIGGKSLRRFGLPAIMEATGLSFGWSWKYLIFLLYIPLLSIGYGVDSQLGAFCGHVEWLIRLLYSVLLALPFIIFGWVKFSISLVTLGIAFQVQAGSLGTISWFGDILIEDIVRYGVLATNVLFVCMTNKKK